MAEEEALIVRTVDYHTAGEPFRIVTGGVPTLRGRTVIEKRDDAAGRLDRYRRLLVNEPRGHADMYGCFVTEPDDDGAHLGVVFFHNDGYSTACGHGTIALVTWAIDEGLVPAEGDEARVMVDVPSGRLETVARLEGRRVRSVRFRNVPAFVQERDVEVRTSAGTVRADAAYGGAYYGSVPAAAVGLRVEPGSVDALIGLGREIRRGLDEAGAGRHPQDDRLSGTYGIIFHEDVGPLHQRNITVFADGEVDRSPCGSGTSARLAVLHADGAIGIGEDLIHESVIGTRFRAWVVEETTVHDRPAVITEVEGAASLTGRHTFVLDPRDELGTGFLLR